jgi:hypothetical protein
LKCYLLFISYIHVFKMKNIRHVTVIASVLIILNSASVLSQENTVADSISLLTDKKISLPAFKKELKNTVLINATNPLIITPKFFTVGYERILSDNQSFSVSIGSFSVPKFLKKLADR